MREVTLKGFDPTNFVTSQVFYESKDGTKIPMFIVHKKVRHFVSCKICDCDWSVVTWL